MKEKGRMIGLEYVRDESEESVLERKRQSTELKKLSIKRLLAYGSSQHELLEIIDKIISAKYEGRDTLVFSDFFVVADNWDDLFQVVDYVIEKGWRLMFENVIIIQNKADAEWFKRFVQSVSNCNRKFSINKMQKGKRAAKESGLIRDGRPPKYSPSQLEHAALLLKNKTYKEVEEETGISKSTLIRFIKGKKNNK